MQGRTSLKFARYIASRAVSSLVSFSLSLSLDWSLQLFWSSGVATIGYKGLVQVQREVTILKRSLYYSHMCLIRNVFYSPIVLQLHYGI